MGNRPTRMDVAPGTLLIAPPDAGPRAAHVLCVFDRDSDEEGAFFALVLNEPTERPAEPVAFYLPVGGEDVAWWGGPTDEALALVELDGAAIEQERELPEARGPRPFVTERAAVFFPFRDHPPEPSVVRRVRVFVGSIWLSREQTELYRDEGVVLAASDDTLFDRDHATLRAPAPAGVVSRRSARRDRTRRRWALPVAEARVERRNLVPR